MASAHVTLPQNIGRKIELASASAIGKDMLRRGIRVENRAKALLAENPKRIDTGRLRSSIATVPFSYKGTFGVRVGTNVQYAIFVHEGTGLYGPLGRMIIPRRAKFLKFTPKGSPRAVFARMVRGMRANPFLRDALPVARD